MSDIIHWDELPMGSIQALWHPYILSGTVNLIQGDSTAGKPFLSQAIVAALTTGKPLPNAEPIPPYNVVIQNAENSLQNVIKPRLQQLGADFSRIKSINEEQERLSLLSPKIEEIISQYDAKLFIADPVQGYMNLYNLREVRRTIMHLGQVAARTGCAVLLIGHLTKSQSKAQYRGLGSIDIFNAIPSVLNLGKIDEDVRVIVHNKSNFFEVGVPYAIGLQGGFRWIGEYDITLDELLADEAKPKRGHKLEKAKEFLAELLADGPVDSVMAYKEGREQGIADRTLLRALAEIGGYSKQQPDRSSIWFLD